MDYCYSPHPKEFYTLQVWGPGRKPLWMWNLIWLAFPSVDQWEQAQTDEQRLVLARDECLMTFATRALHARDDEELRPIMLLADKHPKAFLRAFEASDIEVGYYLMEGLIAQGDDPDSVIITRANLAAARIDGATAPPSVRQEGNVIHAQFGKRSSA